MAYIVPKPRIGIIALLLCLLLKSRVPFLPLSTQNRIVINHLRLLNDRVRSLNLRTFRHLLALLFRQTWLLANSHHSALVFHQRTQIELVVQLSTIPRKCVRHSYSFSCHLFSLKFSAKILLFFDISKFLTAKLSFSIVSMDFSYLRPSRKGTIIAKYL